MNYSEYLKLDSILNSQELKSEDQHDEMLFIIIHQSYELWFKQILHEGYYLMNLLDNDQYYQAISTVKRILVILKNIVSAVDILETMSPLSFLSFRDRLQESSGFQSMQFRLVEIFLGRRNPKIFQNYVEDSPEWKKLKEAFSLPSVYDKLLAYFDRRGFSLPSSVLQRDFACAYESSSSVEDALMSIYQENPKLLNLCEKFVDLDEGIQEWRYRHVKMVERTIGGKMGTGGSMGVEYLRKTLLKPVFPELWSVRSRF